MSVVRKYVVKPRLAELIKKPGGISAREALRRADTVIADAREGCLAEIDRLMARIREESLAPMPDTETVYSLSADMVAVCVGPDDEALAQVGKSLCDLIDRTAVAGQVNRTALEVHLSSMRALHRTGADAATRRALLDGLAKVVAKLDA